MLVCLYTAAELHEMTEPFVLSDSYNMTPVFPYTVFFLIQK